MKVPLTELNDRMNRFRERMDATDPGWEMAGITAKVPLYYFTGTMQDGLLIIPRNGDATFWVRMSYERALEESFFPDIRKMRSYRDIAAVMKDLPTTIHLETEHVSFAQFQRMQKHLRFTDVRPVDDQIGAVRAKKSPYELALMERAGEIHRHVLEDLVPGMLAEGMDEVTLACDLYSVMVREGHQGIIRFGMFNEMVMGQIGFGTSSLSPICVDTPGGVAGMHPSVPQMGCRERKLKPGDLVIIDIGCGVNGYQTDKTLSYMFKKPIMDAAIRDHLRCVEIQDMAASMLKPGEIPSVIYQTIMDDLDEDFKQNFMGYKERRVKFLGHGIGLVIDEMPVIAKGFDKPIVENMTFAIEPKMGIKDIGMVGIENTFVVTPHGGECITGDNTGLIPIY